MPRHSCVDSGVIIARMLHTEGFTQKTASRVKNWFKRQTGNTQRVRRYFENKRAFGELCKRLELSKADRLVIGHFIGQNSAIAFEAGLRIGMTTQLFPASESDVCGTKQKQPHATAEVSTREGGRAPKGTPD